MNCPNCKTPIDDSAVTTAAMSILGRRGKGAKKARPSDAMRKAAKKSWDPAHSKRFRPKKPTSNPTQPTP